MGRSTLACESQLWGVAIPDLYLRLARPLAAKQLDRYFKHIGVRSFILYGAPLSHQTGVQTTPPAAPGTFAHCGHL